VEAREEEEREGAHLARRRERDTLDGVKRSVSDERMVCALKVRKREGDNAVAE